MADKEEVFLDYRPEWTTHTAAEAAGFEQYKDSEKFKMLVSAGWRIEARRHHALRAPNGLALNGWALWLVRG